MSIQLFVAAVDGELTGAQWQQEIRRALDEEAVFARWQADNGAHALLE